MTYSVLRAPTHEVGMGNGSSKYFQLELQKGLTQMFKASILSYKFQKSASKLEFCQS